MRSAWILGIASALWLMTSCSTEEEVPGQPSASAAQGSGGQSAGGAGGTGGSGGMKCGTASDTVYLMQDKTKLTMLAFDDGKPYSNLRLQNFKISKQPGQVQKDHVFNDEPVHEAVRFELARPAKIYGFEVVWAMPEGIDPRAELEAGLYGDFGYNGFDFWKPDPLWSGTRCAGEADKSGTLFYAFDKPVEVKVPGLVYVAHLAKPKEAVWWFDQPSTKCEKFADCQSAFNLPEAEKQFYYNGLSFPFQNHYLVRLFVEYTDEVKPEQRIFQPFKDSPASQHASWGDFDGDGYDDLLLANKLYRNEGNGTFSDVTVKAKLDKAEGTGGVWGDYDNDGCLDLFIFSESYSRQDYLLHSKCDGTFEEVTVAAGLDDTQSYNTCGDPVKNTHAPSAAASWIDIDADGKLDLYVANFNCWNDYSYYVDTVYRNKGNGTFENITAKNGFLDIKTPSRGVTGADADGDGDTDLFINNYVLIPNLFYRNEGNGTVVERSKEQGLAGTKTTVGINNYYGHTIGAAWGDLDNDADFDLIAAKLAHPRFFHFSDKTNVLINDGKGMFTDIKGDFKKPESAAGLRYQETHSVPLLADFDQDGNLDLVITAVYDGRPTDFYWGKGDGKFTLDSFHAGITTTNGWGVAAADYDHDGDMDLFATTLFRNDQPAAKKGHFLQVKVTGTKANRSAIGATVKVKTGATTRIRHVQGGSGKGGQDSHYLHFGLGAADKVDEIRVVFPGGKESVFAGPINADQRVWLTEDATKPAFGWKPPS